MSADIIAPVVAELQLGQSNQNDVGIDIVGDNDINVEEHSLRLTFEDARKTMFPSLSSGICYLDNAGNSIPRKDYLEAYFNLISTTLLSNTHSYGISGNRSESLIANTRRKVLEMVGLDEGSYDVCFFGNSTQALKFLGESFYFDQSNAFIYAMNSHTSAVSIRTYASNVFTLNSEVFQYEDCLETNNYGDKSQVNNREKINISESSSRSLLVVPGECNFSGVKCDLEKTARILRGGAGSLLSTMNARAIKIGGNNIDPSLQMVPPSSLSDPASFFDIDRMSGDNNLKQASMLSSVSKSGLCWCLDASKLAASSQIDLSRMNPEARPDFIVLSFYKIFGFPTGIAALIIKRSSFKYLKQKTFLGGGTVLAIAASSNYAVPKFSYPLNPALQSSLFPSTLSVNSTNYNDKYDLHDSVEDGTLNYQGIAAVSIGISNLYSTMGGMDKVSSYTNMLVSYLIRKLMALSHSTHSSDNSTFSKRTCIVMYGNVAKIDGGSTANTSKFRVNKEKQGPIVAFNVFWADGTPVSYSFFNQLATMENIQVRSGCFCNIGACEQYLNLNSDDIKINLSHGRTCGDMDGEKDIVNGKVTGAVRISLGYYNVIEDCDRVIDFIRRHFVDQCPPRRPVEADLKLAEGVAMNSNNNSDICSENNNSRDGNGEAESLAESSPTLPTQVRISHIIVYPIKSCGGLVISNSSLQDLSSSSKEPTLSWPLTSRGLYLDREWAVVDAASRRVLTQKNFPRLAGVKCDIDLVSKQLILSYNSSADVNENSREDEDKYAAIEPPQSVRFSYDDSNDNVDIGDNKTSTNAVEEATDSFLNAVRVCGKKIQVETSSSKDKEKREVDAWLSRILGVTVLLVRRLDGGSQGTTDTYQSNNDISDSGSNNGKIDSFVNDSSFLILSDESIEALNSVFIKNQSLTPLNTSKYPKLVNNISHINFRPNIIFTAKFDRDNSSSSRISSNESSDSHRRPLSFAHMEDSWRSIRLPVHRLPLPSLSSNSGRQNRGSSESYNDDGSGGELFDATGGYVDMEVKGACARCVVVNVFRHGTVVDGRVLQTIAAYRSSGNHTDSSRTSSSEGGLDKSSSDIPANRGSRSINFGQLFNWESATRAALSEIELRSTLNCSDQRINSNCTNYEKSLCWLSVNSLCNISYL